MTDLTNKHIEDLEYLEIALRHPIMDFSRYVNILSGLSDNKDNNNMACVLKYNDAIRQLKTIKSAIKAYEAGNIQSWEG